MNKCKNKNKSPTIRGRKVTESLFNKNKLKSVYK